MRYTIRPLDACTWAAFAELVKPYAGPVALGQVGGNLGTSRAEDRAIARFARRGLSRILGI